MRITHLKTNRIVNPVGFDLKKVMLSFITDDTNSTKQEAAQIEVSLDYEFQEIVFNSGKKEDIDSLGYELKLDLKPCTRYYWRVRVWGNNGDSATSDVAYFETGKINTPWEGRWITPNMNKDIHPVIFKDFNIDKEIEKARIYITGLGLYELYINEEKIGNEYLTPYCTAYDKYIQYQTYDITKELKVGKNNIDVMLGNGWYKGRFGFDGGQSEIFGDKFALLCDLVVEFKDGTKSIIKSDTSWKCMESKVKFSGIYDGEVQDATFKSDKTYEVSEIELPYNKISERLSLPVIVKEEIKPIEVIKTPAGEIVLDMGQNMVGWIKFRNNAPKGQEIKLQYGELLQDGNFYRDNLRTAKAEFIYISNGEDVEVRPYFTFYGFRYVKVEGYNGELRADDFVGQVLYSDMEETGHIETSNTLVNRLFLNAMWGQKCNFLDVPTDCPQRDERMGWTGDAQVFSGTACFNMDTYAFFTKYGNDLYQEQLVRDGQVPMVAPVISISQGCSSAWGDASTVIPWNTYLHFGDKTILEKQFDSMKAWVDYIKREDDNTNGNRLWDSGFHFGDWLALDGENPNLPKGGTEDTFIASAYYCYSARLVSKAAKVLGKEALSREYEILSEEVKKAIISEYFTGNGRLALKNQTAYIMALYMDLVPKGYEKRVARDLAEKIKSDNGYLKTGFVGTPYICRVLSDNGYNELAYSLLLNKKCPSWLYPVTMGATTIWERWNSVLPDGKISGTDMNSLNHYAYGAIAEWMYRNMAGINPVEEAPGFRHVKLAPMPDYRFKYISASLNSPVGLYESKWRIHEDGKLAFEFNIPFNATASAVLPYANLESGYINGKLLSDKEFDIKIEENNLVVQLESGLWKFEYMPTKSYIKYYSSEMKLDELMSHEEAREIVLSNCSAARDLDGGLSAKFSFKSLRELQELPFFNPTPEEMAKVDELLGKIKVEVTI